MNSILSYFKSAANDAASGDDTDPNTASDCENDSDCGTSKVVRANQNTESSSSEETPQDSVVNTAVPGRCLKLCCKDVRTGPN